VNGSRARHSTCSVGRADRTERKRRAARASVPQGDARGRVSVATMQRRPLPLVVARRALVTVLGLVLVGGLATSPVGCSADSYECGDRTYTCEYVYDETACGQRKGCAWRNGCEKPCLDQAEPCVAPCLSATAGTPPDAASCDALASDGCSWVPSCWNDPALACDRDLSEDQCEGRGCQWVKGASQHL
jgi:hypothetical protein